MEIQLQATNERKFRCSFNHGFQHEWLCNRKGFYAERLTYYTYIYFIVTSLKGRGGKFAFQKLLSMYL